MTNLIKLKRNIRLKRLEQLSQAKLNAPRLIINSFKKKELIIQKIFNSRFCKRNSNYNKEKINPILDENGVVLPIDFSVDDANQDTFTGYKLDLNFNALNIGIGEIFQLLNKNVIDVIGNLKKTSSDDFKITTLGYQESGIPFILLDGVKVTVNMEDLEYDFQNKVNPTLNVDNTGAIPIVNEWAFYRSPDFLIHFDRNSLSRGINIFRYDDKNGVWLWKSDSQSRSLLIVSDITYTPIAGYLPLNGYKFVNEEKSLDYPNSYEFGIFADERHTIDMEDASIAGASYDEDEDEDEGETPVRKISQGQIKNITGSAYEGAGHYLVYDGKGDSNVGTGAFKTFRGGSGIVGTGDAKFAFTNFDFDASRVVKTGKQTLTRRFGMNLQWKL